MERSKDHARYAAALHAMQSGVGVELGRTPLKDNPVLLREFKHLRVGINSAMVETSTLLEVLIDRGLITEADYLARLATNMEKEVVRYEKALSATLGANIKLG